MTNLVKHGLAYSISPAVKRKRSNSLTKDEDMILTLAPFTLAPKINLGEVNVDTSVERNLIISNPQDFLVKLKVTSQDLEINTMEIKIPSKNDVNFKISWKPEVPGKYKFLALIETIEGVNLKFLVHLFGTCIPIKQNIQVPRKPLGVLQPLKRTTYLANCKAKTVKSIIPMNDKTNKENITKKSIPENCLTKLVKTQSQLESSERKIFQDLNKSSNESQYFELETENMRKVDTLIPLTLTTQFISENVIIDDVKTPVRPIVSSTYSPNISFKINGLNFERHNSSDLFRTAKVRSNIV